MTKYLKALYGAVLAGLGATATAYIQGHGHIGFVADIFIATTVVTAFGVVWGVPNAAPPNA
jgi:hypothetical protein